MNWPCAECSYWFMCVSLTGYSALQERFSQSQALVCHTIFHLRINRRCQGLNLQQSACKTGALPLTGSCAHATPPPPPMFIWQGVKMLVLELGLKGGAVEISFLKKRLHIFILFIHLDFYPTFPLPQGHT